MLFDEWAISLLNMYEMKKFFQWPRPTNPATVLIYIGGIAVCFGWSFFAYSHCYTEMPSVFFGTFFTTAGKWTVGFSAFYYLVGWWRQL